MQQTDFAPHLQQSLRSRSESRALDRATIRRGPSRAANSRTCTRRHSSISVSRVRFRPSYALIRVRIFEREGLSGSNLSSTRLQTSQRLPNSPVKLRRRRSMVLRIFDAHVRLFDREANAYAFLGPARCMFGSHMPIAGLSVGFERLYDAYQEIVSRFSAVERADM